MGKYEPLTDFLKKQVQSGIELTFEDIEDEDRVGVRLPQAAKSYPAWWANEVDPNTRHYQCRAWTKAGWRVENVDIGRETVVFART